MPGAAAAARTRRARANGDTDTVYFLVFSDSHNEPEYNLGYGWSTYWGPRDGCRPGSATRR